MMKKPLLGLVSVLSVVQVQAGGLTQREINQIESGLNITLSSNEIAQLSAIVLPANMPQWRIDAYNRIDAHRKADLDIRVVDMNGDPVEGARVGVKLKSNDFKFGGVFSLKDFTDEDGNLSNNGFTEQGYKDLLLAMFNSVGLDNGFKPKQRAGNAPLIPNFLSWVQANDLPVRGHLLIWPGNDTKNHMPDELPDTPTSYSVLSKVEAVEAALTNGSNQATIDALKADLKSEIGYMIADWASRWGVYEWDVINETLSNHRVQDLLGYGETAEWFKVAQSNVVDPDCKLLINEFQIISARSEALDPGHYAYRRDRYYESIDYVIDNGGRLDRIGFQSRVKFEVPNPQTWYDRLDEFATAYGRPMVGTEFEVRDSDPGTTYFPYYYTEQERAQITEELLTAYYSHPLTTGLNAWTFMKDELYSLCNYDGTVKLNGLAWYYLHRIRYNTDVVLASSLGGRTGVRAFKGDYGISVSYKGQDYTTTLAHTNDQQIVVTLNSSIADEPNTSEVVDAWHYDGLTNGAGLAQGTSTGIVGGVSFNNTALASIRNEAVRWQSDGVTDSIYQGNDLSSYDGASNGLFQLSVDFLDADFSASAATSNGSGRVNFGIRNDPGGTKDDAYFRLAFLSGGGSNAQYRLEVKDAASNNKSVATFPGTTLDHLSVRAVYDLDNDTFDVYYRHDGGAEQLAHSGTLVTGFALDQLRTVVQVFNGGVNWAAGDQIFTDNLVVRKLGDPPPPPSEVVIDGWYYEGLADGSGQSAAVSVGNPGGVAFDDSPIGTISNNAVRWAYNGSTASNFKSVNPSDYDGATSGVFQVEWDYVSADFANTVVAGTTANIGFGIRSDPSAAKDDASFRLRFDGTQFQIQFTDGNGKNQAGAAFAGHTLSNLHVRMVVDLDQRGAAGSYKLYYTLDGGGEMAVVEDGILAAAFAVDQLRYAVQTTNGGTGWQLGDVVLTDNLVFSKLTLSADDTPASLLGDWLAGYPGLGGKTNLVDNPDADIANNLAEYAFGGDPTNGTDIGYWPTSSLVEAGASNYIEYVYARRTDAEARGLSYTLQNTGDLVGGSWTNTGFEFVGEGAVDAGFDAVTNRLPATNGVGFIRLKIDYTP